MPSALPRFVTKYCSGTHLLQTDFKVVELTECTLRRYVPLQVKRLERSIWIVCQRVTRVPNGSTICEQDHSSRIERSNGLSFDRRTSRPALHLDRAPA